MCIDLHHCMFEFKWVLWEHITLVVIVLLLVMMIVVRDQLCIANFIIYFHNYFTDT